MGAIAKHFDIRTAILQVLAANIDLALICHKGPSIETAYEVILAELTDSQAMKARGLQSVERIMRLKSRYLDLD